MKKYFSNRTRVCNLLCSVLMIILVALQFMPFFTYGEAGETASIQSYVWFPTEYSALEKEITFVVPGHSIASLVPMPLIVILCCAVGLVMSLFMGERPFVSVFPAACGLAGVWGYLTKPEFQLGANWQWHLILSIIIAAAGVLSLIMNAGSRKKTA